MLLPSDWIQIAGIVITTAATIGVGWWVGTKIQHNFAKSRTLRDYFMGELSSLQSFYREFVNKILADELDAVTVKNTLKDLSLRIDNLDKFMHLRYKISERIIKDAHTKFQQEVTGHDEFNEQFRNEKLVLTPATKAFLSPLYAEIANSITERVININEAEEILPKHR